MTNHDIIRPRIWADQDMITAGFTTRALDSKFNQIGDNSGSLADKFRILSGLYGTDISSHGIIGNNEQGKQWGTVNRGHQSQEIGLRLAYAKQVHGDHVVIVKEPGYVGEADGLVTTSINLTLAIQVADCGVVLLADRTKGVVAALHSGWRGTAADIAGKTIDYMKRQGCDAANIEAFIGPCISGEIYEVGEEVASQFDERFVLRNGFDKPHLAIQEALKQQLFDSGISEQNLEIDRRCTYLNPDLFHSYRRDGKKSGRMIGYIRLNRE